MAFEIIQGFNLSKNGPLDVRAIATSEADMLGIKWVHEGMAVVRTDFSPYKIFISKVSSAPNGANPYTTITDWEEFTGPAGANGVDGSQILAAAGVPAGPLGNNGDFYINVTTGDYYIKAADTWGAAEGNLTGPQGPQGNQGVPGTDGDKYATVTSTDINFTAALDPLTITVEQNLSWTVGQEVVVALQSDAINVNLVGTVTSYLPSTATNNMVISGIVYTGTGSYTTDFDVNLTGAPGAAGADGAPGDDGAAGKALIHTEADITLTSNKVTEVQTAGGGNAYSPQNPWSASVQFDARGDVDLDPGGNINNPAGIVGSMTRHSISYDGANWYDNGTWVGADAQPAYSPLPPTTDPSTNPNNLANSPNGNWWIDNGLMTSTYKDSGIQITGSAGAPGQGTVIYTHKVSVDTTLDTLSQTYDFTIPCELHLTVASGRTFYFSGMRITNLINTKLRRVTVSFDNAINLSYTTLPARVQGQFQGHGLATYGANVMKTGSFVDFLPGEFAVFTPVYNSDGSYEGNFLSQFSGRALDASTQDYNYSTISPTSSDQDEFEGMWNFRVKDGICHYAGKFRAIDTSQTQLTDTVPLGPTITYPFTPDPAAGTVTYNSLSYGPGSAIFPLNVNAKTGVYNNYYFYSASTYVMVEGEFRAHLYITPSHSNAATDVRLVLFMNNVSGNINKWFHIQGSYPVASPNVSSNFFNQGAV